MKYILIISLIILAAGCSSIDETIQTEAKNLQFISYNADNDASVVDVLLTSRGFEKDEVSIGKGDSLDILVMGDIKCRYITLDGVRVSGRDLLEKDRISLAFPEKGTFGVTDENSQYFLTVNVI